MRFLAATVLALTLVTPAYAANQAAKPFEAVVQKEPGDIYASELMGMRVYATDKDVTSGKGATSAKDDWDDIGEIDDIVLNEDGQVKAVIVGVGGFLGIGERDVAVKMSSLNMVREKDDDDDYFLVINADKDRLMNAPAYGRTTASAMDQKTHSQMKAESDEDKAAAERATADDTKMAAKDADRHEQKMTRPTVEREGYSDATAKDMTAEMLQGATVYDANKEEVGEIEKLVIGDNGQIDRVVIDVGGFLGVGERPVAFQMDELQFLREDDGDDVVVIVDAKKSDLEAKPTYKG